jgi:Tol biopolymer transport system component
MAGAMRWAVVVVVVGVLGWAAGACGGSDSDSDAAPAVVENGPSLITFRCRVGHGPLAERAPKDGLLGGTCATGADGSAPVRISGSSRATLSPDGERVAFSTQSGGRASNAGDLRVAKNDGTGEQVLWSFTAEAKGSPAWSPGGDKLAITIKGVAYGGTEPPPGSTPAGLWVIDVATKGARRVAPEALGPAAWDPSGTTIAYSTDTDPPALKTIPSSGGRSKGMPSIVEPGQDTDTLSWSPDGRSILASFSAVRTGGSKIERIPAGGGQPTVVLQGAAEPGSQETKGIDYQGAIYSPDGDQFAVAVGCYSSSCQMASGYKAFQQLMVARLDGSQLTPVNTGENRVELAPTSWVRQPASLPPRQSQVPAPPTT